MAFYIRGTENGAISDYLGDVWVAMDSDNVTGILVTKPKQEKFTGWLVTLYQLGYDGEMSFLVRAVLVSVVEQ